MLLLFNTWLRHKKTLQHPFSADISCYLLCLVFSCKRTHRLITHTINRQWRMCDTLNDGYTTKTRSSPIGWARHNASPIKFDPKPPAVTFSAVFFIFDKSRPEVPGDVISGVAIDSVGVDVHVKFSAHRLNSGRIIRLFGRPDPLLRTFLQNLISSS